MDYTVKMPQLGETVTEGTVVTWLKKPGDQVQKYEPLLEVVTAKVTAEVPSPETGRVKEILVPEGETVPVGAPLCILEVEGAAQEGAKAPEGEKAETPAAAAPAEASARDEERRYSPAVRRLAKEHGIDLSKVKGTGAGGRVTVADVEAYLAKEREAAAPAPAPAPSSRPEPARLPVEPAAKGEEEVRPPVSLPGDRRVPLTPIRRAIAQNMAESARTIPHAWTMVEADVTAIEAYIQREGEAFRSRYGVPLTFLPFAIQAAVEALQAVPQLNASWGGDHILLRGKVNIGIAVATDQGLMVPVIHDADQLNLAGLARRVYDLAQRARQGQLRLEDVEGATFTVDNTGALGTLLSMPIIPPGQAGILTTERAQRKPVVVGDGIAIRTMMALCLSFDHRVADGAEAARFLQEVKRRLEAFQG